MDLMKMATQIFISKIGGSSGLDTGVVTKALSVLLPTSGGSLDLQGLLSQLNGGGLASMAASWLGDGGNDNISAQQVMSLFGQSKISEFAGTLGIGEGQAAEGLSGMLPELIDKSSAGGSLLKSVGGGLLGKLF